jgi:hypothetical protein
LKLDESGISEAWRRYRQWSRAFWIVFVLYLPVLGFVGRELRPMGGGATVIFIAATVWLVAATAIGYRKWNFQCPRCGDLFFHKFDDRPWRMSWQHNPFARHCMHCGLHKWAAAPD